MIYNWFDNFGHFWPMAGGDFCLVFGRPWVARLGYLLDSSTCCVYNSTLGSAQVICRFFFFFFFFATIELWPFAGGRPENCAKIAENSRKIVEKWLKIRRKNVQKIKCGRTWLAVGLSVGGACGGNVMAAFLIDLIFCTTTICQASLRLPLFISSLHCPVIRHPPFLHNIM